MARSDYRSDKQDTRTEVAAEAASEPVEPATEEPASTVSERLRECGSEPTMVRGREMDRATVLKFAGLIVFIVLLAIIMVAIWPLIADVFTEGGVERLVERVQNAGAFGVAMLLGMQLLQIIVAFIPGEFVQLAAGLMYGPWLGSMLIIIGCVVSSALVYKLVHVLGAPFVQSMVSTEHLERFRRFEESGKLDIIVFILFLIPGMPKDVFTYIVPLTDMKLGKFLLLTTIGRTPGIVGSAYAAAGLADGQIVGPIIVLVVLAVIAVAAIALHDRILDAFGRRVAR